MPNSIKIEQVTHLDYDPETHILQVDGTDSAGEHAIAQINTLDPNVFVTYVMAALLGQGEKHSAGVLEATGASFATHHAEGRDYLVISLKVQEATLSYLLQVLDTSKTLEIAAALEIVVKAMGGTGDSTTKH